MNISDIQNVKNLLVLEEKKKFMPRNEKKPVELTTELPYKVNVYVHIIKICLLYLSHYQTDEREG